MLSVICERDDSWGGPLSILEELSDGGLSGDLDGPTKSPPARTLTRALLILQIVALHDDEPLSLAKIARTSGLPKPTVHRLVGVLCDAGMLQRDEEGCYLPGPMLLVMGTNYLRKIRLREASRNTLLRLHRITSQAVYLGVPQSPWVVNIARIESTEQARVTDYVGSLNPLHTTATGKVLLAFGNSEALRDVLRAGLTAKTSHSIASGEALVQELEKVFQDGFATELEENEQGVVSVAAPIFNHTRMAVGAIGISAPQAQATRLTIRTWASEVTAASHRISYDLGWTGTAYGVLGNRKSETAATMRTVS